MASIQPLNNIQTTAILCRVLARSIPMNVRRDHVLTNDVNRTPRANEQCCLLSILARTGRA